MKSWIEQILPIIDEYKDGDDEALDGDEVDRLCDIIKAKINLHQGNITEEEYESLIDEDDDKRTCNQCSKEMKEGYCINGGEEYYCSGECLNKKYTPEQWEEMYDHGNSDSYWTTWE